MLISTTRFSCSRRPYQLALERERKGVPCENPLLLEIQQFYRKEYALAGRALQIVKEYMGIQMSEEEQGFITLHIVNATMPQRSDRLIISVQLVRDVLAIVSERYATTLDDTSLPYERFVRHLQFFAQRALDPAAGQINGDALFRIDETAYPRAFSCAESIADHLASTYNVVVTDARRVISHITLLTCLENLVSRHNVPTHRLI